MIKSTFILTLCFFISLIGFAQETEEEQITKVLNYYLDGGTNNDLETLKRAFHTEAAMEFINQNGHQTVNALTFFERGMQTGQKQDRETTILDIDISGNAAAAKLRIDYDTFYFIDYMNLLKIEGSWKIVNKIFSRTNKQLYETIPIHPLGFGNGQCFRTRTGQSFGKS